MIEQLKKEYLEWTQQKIKLEKIGDFVEIVTPFVDLHHDYISLFFTKEANGFQLTDDGYIMNELRVLGLDLNNSIKRKNFFNTTLKVFGVRYNKDTMELYVRFNNMNEYPEMQHRLIQCIVRVSDLILTSRNKVVSFFTEDITNFFLENDIYFTENPSFTGRTGRNNTFDFSLPRSKRTKPKLIKAVNNPTADAYKDPLLAFLDVTETKTDHDFIVLANDTKKNIDDKFAEPLQNFGVNVLAWSNRKNWVNDLKSS